MDDDARLRRRGQAPEEDDIWFEPKRYGYGAGLPISREGWIALGSYVAVMMLMAAAIGPLTKANPLYILVPVAIMAGMTIWFVPLCARHTRGGWRWRWGGDD
jgi:lipopolysaccharide export LptBFGC system permease protein LptF